MSFFRDHSDLRLSARLVFRQMCDGGRAGSEVLPTVDSLRHGVAAVISDAAAAPPTRRDVEAALRQCGAAASINGPFDEAAFVAVVEAIFSRAQSDQGAARSHVDDLSAPSPAAAAAHALAARFFAELLRTDVAMRHDHTRGACVGRDAFDLCMREALVSPAVTATLWNALTQCEAALSASAAPVEGEHEDLPLRPRKASPAQRRGSCSVHGHDASHAAAGRRHFPFAVADGNVEAPSGRPRDAVTCVSQRAVERCMRLGALSGSPALAGLHDRTHRTAAAF